MQCQEMTPTIRRYKLFYESCEPKQLTTCVSQMLVFLTTDKKEIHGKILWESTVPVLTTEGETGEKAWGQRITDRASFGELSYNIKSWDSEITMNFIKLYPTSSFTNLLTLRLRFHAPASTPLSHGCLNTSRCHWRSSCAWEDPMILSTEHV